MHRTKSWTIAEADPAAAELASRLKTSPLIAQVLLNRGLKQPDDCERFLRPNLKLLHEPALLPNLIPAAQRIARAIGEKQRIVIYGDYDVDGITATAILWHAIGALGGNVDFYIPHRIEEGYGLNSQAIAQICDSGAQVIVSVDCGITAIEPARIARERGVDLIVTDHHDWHLTAEQPAENGSAPSARQPMLPDCCAIVHPRLGGSGVAYPNPSLCGAGVAFKLAWGIGQVACGADRVNQPFREFLVEATALAALGTIADVVPLIGENRALAHFGLSGLRNSKIVGIKALIASAGLTGQNLDSFHVGFSLAPRLNASGRMGHARLAVEMLTTSDEKRAMEIATYLEQQNRSRQAMERKILDEADQQVAEHKLAEDGCRAIVVGAEGWHPGVIGIVASRLVDRYHRPAVMVALNNGHGQGSARSIAGFHLAHALEACASHLESYGGHEMAAGLKIETPKFADFREAFCSYAMQTLTPEQLVPEIIVESLGELRQFTAALVGDLNRLGPFGHGNRRPVFVCRNLTVAGPPRRCGKTGQHLQLAVRQGEQSMKCIAFGMGDLELQLKSGTIIDLAVEPVLNEYNGRTNVELEVKDLQIQDGSRPTIS